MNVIACDLDGVLDVPENVIKLNALFEDKSNFIVIHTARSYSILMRHENTYISWVLNIMPLVMEKIRADIYIDDKNSTL